MLLFAPPEFESVASALRERVSQLCPGRYQVGRFDNGELKIDIETAVKAERCFVLGSIAPPDARLLSTLLLAHTLRKDGALEVVGILPYLAYSRQDKDKPHQSLAAAWSGALMKASGFDRVITIDEHSLEDERLFPIPLISLSPARLFADALKQNGLTQATIIAPDEGAIGRCEAIKTAAGLAKEPVPYFEKQRTETGIALSAGSALRLSLLTTFWTQVPLWFRPANGSCAPASRISRSWLPMGSSRATNGRGFGNLA